MLIIIDVEGHEKPVLEGAMETLKSNRVLLYVEIEVERDCPGKERKILGSLHSLGYRLIHRRVHVNYKRGVSRCILVNF